MGGNPLEGGHDRPVSLANNITCSSQVQASVLLPCKLPSEAVLLQALGFQIRTFHLQLALV